MNNNNENNENNNGKEISEDEIKSILEGLTQEFNKKGLNISAKVIKLNPKNPNQLDSNSYSDTKGEFKEMFEKILEDFENYMRENGGDENNDEQCLCPNCFNPNTFEQVLGPKDGKFEYGSIVFNNRNFNIKYWSDGKSEYVMIDPETPLTEVFNSKKLTEEEILKRNLENAIEKEDYIMAREISNKIENFKQNKTN